MALVQRASLEDTLLSFVYRSCGVVFLINTCISLVSPVFTVEQGECVRK